MPSTRVRLLFATACVALAASCGGSGSTPSPTPVATKPGVLAVSAIPALDPFPTTAAEYNAAASAAFDLVYGAGARGQMTTFTWSALEPAANRYDSTRFADLAAQMAQAQTRGLTQYVGLQLINTTARELPPDLNALAFDHPAVIARFHALLDRVVTPYRGRIRYLSIGNEVDAYLRAHPTEWTAYKRFLADAIQYAHTLDPAIQVGVTGTADGALTLSPAELADLNAATDVTILTYYPLQADATGTITARDPGVVAGDFTRMLQFAGTRKLVLQEVGYPAATLNNSSDALQAAFVTNVFAAWKNANGRIPFINVFLLHDFTAQMCADFGVYYGLPNVPSFTAYLCSLGLRKVDGTPRPAWSTLVNEARAAGLP